MDTNQTTIEKKATAFVSYLQKEHGLPVTKAYLFGSRAKGMGHNWSDIDVCIVSPFFENEDALAYLWTRLRKEDIRNAIEPVGFAPKDFEEKIPSPLIDEIKKHGKEIYTQ